MNKPRKLKGTKKGDIFCSFEPNAEELIFDGKKWVPRRK